MAKKGSQQGYKFNVTARYPVTGVVPAVAPRVREKQVRGVLPPYPWKVSLRGDERKPIFGLIGTEKPGQYMFKAEGLPRKQGVLPNDPWS
jgi:hypothetical protein